LACEGEDLLAGEALLPPAIGEHLFDSVMPGAAVSTLRFGFLPPPVALDGLNGGPLGLEGREANVSLIHMRSSSGVLSSTSTP